MKTTPLILSVALGAGIAAATGFALYRTGVSQGMNASKAAPVIAAAPSRGTSASRVGDIDPATGKRVLYWHDPMAPGQKFDRPGRSPYMDMQLVPVYAEDGNADGNAVSISPRVQQNLGVRTAEVKRGTLEQAVEAIGSVAYNDRDVAVVQARSNGFLERLFVRAPLDRVRRGQPLAELYVPEWVAAQEEYLSAKRIGARNDGAAFDGLLDAARQRMRLAGMSEEHIRRIEASGVVQVRLTLTAPIGGVVTELTVREGMTVMAGAPLFRINGLDTVWVNAELPESLSALVRPGNAVEARTTAMPGTIFRGKASAILPEVNAATRTMKVRVELSNPGGRLVPGMFATVHFTSQVKKKALLVPTEAVIRTGKRNVIIVADGEGRFTPVEVELGAESNGQTQVESGLSEGQKVVTSGQFLIDSEASLKGTTSRMRDVSLPAGAAGPIHRTVGRIEAIDKDEITLSHEAVPGLKWDAMTMNFAVTSASVVQNVSVGQVVDFEFRRNSEGTYEIVSIAPPRSQPAAPEEPAKEHVHGNATTGGTKP
jgi:membrane fusion protein, copper/silver efflux system